MSINEIGPGVVTLCSSGETVIDRLLNSIAQLDEAERQVFLDRIDQEYCVLCKTPLQGRICYCHPSYDL